MEQGLNDADWLITRIKSESSSTRVVELFGPLSPSLESQAEGRYSDLCERLMHFVAACSELVQTAISAGPAMEGLLKVHAFNTLFFATCINTGKRSADTAYLITYLTLPYSFVYCQAVQSKGF